VPRERLTREDVSSLVEARRELGEEMEPAVIDAFLDRVEAAAEARASERRPPQELYPGQGRGAQLALSIVSLGTGIPITAIAAEQGVQGIIVAWLGIVGVNFAFSRKK
jgi:hypothetical protein